MPIWKNSATNRGTLLALGALIAGTTIGLGGCASPGHGKVTSEHLAQAEQRMNDMRAATEWDMAQQQFLAGDLEKSLKTVDNSISMANSVAKSHSLRGRILYELGQPDAAFEAFRRALAIDPEFVDAHYFKGVIHERFREYDKAMQSYMTAAKLDETNPQYPLAAAEVCIETGRLDEAERILNDRQDRFEHNAGFRQTLGHIAQMRGNDRLAARFFGEARILAPEDHSILEDLSIAQVGAGMYAEASYSLGQLLKGKHAGDRRDLEHLQAKCFMEMDRPVEARSILLGLTEGVEGSTDIRAWFELGQCAYKLGDMRRVKITASRLIAMAPGGYEGYFLMAALHRHEGDLASALTALDKAASLTSEDASPMLFRGIVLSEMGRQSEAARSLAEALRLDPDNKDAEQLLALVVEQE
ncbi:MAG: tetratricopeptide repeat protein [Phycisphaeraceae bacterium]|nr:tetratricopeptide repeat protein [Phycisphaeraceae bacterium]